MNRPWSHEQKLQLRPLPLSLICEHITTSLAMDLEDFEYTPFTQYGGLGRAHQVFGADLVELLEELNRTLAA